jgi:hypothetical protein
MIFGSITGGDTNAGIIQVNSQFGGQQTIRVNANTQFIAQKTVLSGELKVDDQVQVQGVPTAITASSITAGQLPEGFRMGGPGGFGGPVGPGGPGGFGQRGGQGAQGNRANQQAMASATGKVTSTSPLTISVGDGVSIVLKLASDAKITKYVKTNISGLKVGDQIMAMGQPGADGSFSATNVGVNFQGGMGFGGGFGPGGFGPGGPGGFGPGVRGGRGPSGPGGPGGGPEGPGGGNPPPPPSA